MAKEKDRDLVIYLLTAAVVLIALTFAILAIRFS